MKAITTKYVGPTNTRGSRVVASDSDGNRASVPYDSSGGREDSYHQAAKALCNKMGWSGCDRMVSGGTKEGRVFVFLPSSCSCAPGDLGRARPRSRGRRRR